MPGEEARPYCHNCLPPLPCDTLGAVHSCMRLAHAYSKCTRCRTPGVEDPFNSEEEESCEEESDLTAAFEREMDELASVVEELEDTMDVQDVEDLREL